MKYWLRPSTNRPIGWHRLQALRHNQPRTRLQKGPATLDRWTCTNSPRLINENRRSRGDGFQSEPLATGPAFLTDLVIGRSPSTVDENRNQPGASVPRTNGFT